jgi:hypothetical protein
MVEVIGCTISSGSEDYEEHYAALAMHKWQESEVGQWLIKNSNPNAEWKSIPDVSIYGTKFIFVANLTPELYTFWKLKYE